MHHCTGKCFVLCGSMVSIFLYRITIKQDIYKICLQNNLTILGYKSRQATLGTTSKTNRRLIGSSIWLWEVVIV